VLADLRYTTDATGLTTLRDQSALVQIAIDGSAPRIISPMPTYIPSPNVSGDMGWQMSFNTSADWHSGSTVTLMRAFENSATFNPSGSLASGPQLYGVFDLDATTGVYTRRTPLPDVSWLDQSRPIEAKVAPNGSVYGELGRPLGGGCNGRTYDLAVLNLASGASTLTTPEFASACSPFNYGFDWGVERGSGNTDPAPPRLVVDVPAAPDDPNEPDTGDVTEITEPDAMPAPGADDLPAPVIPAAATLPDIVVPADTSTVVTLRTVDGSARPFEIVEPPPTSEMTFGGVQGAAGFGMTTGLDGQVVVTPAPGFRGTTSFTFASVGDLGHPATATVSVVGNAAPIAGADSLTAVVGADLQFDRSVLLSNDHDPDSVGPLSVVSVFGSDNGRAWIDVDGVVHVAATTAGTAEFRYLVADTQGAIGEGTVTVAVSPAAPGPPTELVVTPGDARLSIAWAPPALSGGSPITGYTVTVTPADGGAAKSTMTTVPSATVTGLTNGVVHDVTVVANNAAGPGDAVHVQGTPVAPPAPGLRVRLVAGAIAPATPKSDAGFAVAGTWTAPPSTSMRCGEPVTITVGALTETLPGSRFKSILGICTYVRPSKTASFSALVTLDLKRGAFAMAGEGRTPTFSPFVNPVAITLRVGDDTGSTANTFVRHGAVWTYPS
jgi:hypothetical protein